MIARTIRHDLDTRRLARIAGVLYLVIIACGLFSELVVRGTLVVPGDAAATAANILAADTLFRVGVVSDLVMFLADVAIVEVAGVTSTRNVELVRSLGATLDYTTRNVVDGAERYDAVIDAAGSHGPSAWRRVLTPTGTLVLVGGPHGRWVGGMPRFATALALSRLVSQRLVPLFSTPRGADLAELVTAGKLTPVLDRTFALPDAPDAIRHVGAGHTRGKVVVTR